MLQHRSNCMMSYASLDLDTNIRYIIITLLLGSCVQDLKFSIIFFFTRKAYVFYIHVPLQKIKQKNSINQLFSYTVS